MWALLARIGLWLVRLADGPVAAREAGRLEQQAINDRIALTRTQDIRCEQAEIAAGHAVNRNAVLQRMRDDTL